MGSLPVRPTKVHEWCPSVTLLVIIVVRSEKWGENLKKDTRSVVRLGKSREVIGILLDNNGAKMFIPLFPCDYFLIIIGTCSGVYLDTLCSHPYRNIPHLLKCPINMGIKLIHRNKFNQVFSKTYGEGFRRVFVCVTCVTETPSGTLPSPISSFFPIHLYFWFSAGRSPSLVFHGTWFLTLLELRMNSKGVTWDSTGLDSGG